MTYRLELSEITRSTVVSRCANAALLVRWKTVARDSGFQKRGVSEGWFSGVSGLWLFDGVFMVGMSELLEKHPTAGSEGVCLVLCSGLRLKQCPL